MLFAGAMADGIFIKFMMDTVNIVNGRKDGSMILINFFTSMRNAGQ